ncbi:hypothetical protein GCM10029978_016870 [Actinoallomurus acanthiterrae]
MATSAWEPSAACDIAAERLIGRFDLIPTETIERCVRSIWVCALYNGARVDDHLLETLAHVEPTAPRA